MKEIGEEKRKRWKKNPVRWGQEKKEWLISRLSEKMNNYTVKKKLYLLYIYCVLLPLILTDSVIIAMVVRTEHVAARHELANIAGAVRYNFTDMLDEAANIANSIYTNRSINDFMDRQYDSPLAYYNGYQELMKDSLFETGIGGGKIVITMYADNPTVVNGGLFLQLKIAKEESWYKYLTQAGQNLVLYPYFDNENTRIKEAKRKISIIRRLNFYGRDNCEKIIKVDIDYSSVLWDLMQMKYETPVYICMGDRILLSNSGYSSSRKDFDTFREEARVGYQETLSVYGKNFEIYVLNKKPSAIQHILDNRVLILLLIVINAVLPWIFNRVLARSFTDRLTELSLVFDKVDNEELTRIERARGDDEIGILMRNYNRMVERTNELIRTVYKERLNEQEMDIARQNAELLALHSQINPHFLFNALESIRMHSILKGERETAHMVEMLAVMQRQYVDWGTDSVTVREEIGFVTAYLELQKYRFGERLSYRIDVEEECKNYHIPKLSIVTFVENACVHGIENKSTRGWVFVRGYQKEGKLCLEIEDTGNGIAESLLSELKDSMAHAGIAELKKKGRVGIMNACLRLRMVTEEKVRFEIESEDSAGTIITIRMPLEYVVGECMVRRS